jgi:hypothetical protein
VSKSTNHTDTTTKNDAAPAGKAPAGSVVATVPSIDESAVSALVDALDAFAQLLGEGVKLPKAEEMKRFPKARKAATTIVSSVTDLTARYRIESKSYPVPVILAQQDLVKKLAPVAERISATMKLVEDVSLMAQSAAWQGTMVNYGLLKNEARGNPVLRKALAPVRDEMRVKYVTPEGTKTVKRSRSKKAKEQAGAEARAPGRSFIA